MFDLLAKVDPVTLPLWATALAAVAMYPLGLMLGSTCGPCPCSAPCDSCTEGELPDTVTVTLDNLPQRVQGPYLCQLFVDGDCFGSGATARVDAPGGDAGVDDGPIESLTITNAGSGYAKLGRVEPTVTATVDGGSDAEITVTLSSDFEPCENDFETASSVPYWFVESLTLVEGGSGYTNGTAVTFEIAEDDTVASSASATIETQASEPTLTASVSGGTGAELEVTILESVMYPDRWLIDEIAVSEGGNGYTDGTEVTIESIEGDVEQEAAYAIIQTTRVEPTVALEFGLLTNGSGAALTPVLNELSDFDSRPYWVVDSITVNDGGSGYEQDEAVLAIATDGYAAYGITATANVDNEEPTISANPGGTGGTGGTLTATLSQSGDVWQISSITVNSSGSGYTQGAPVVVTVSEGTEISAADATLNVDGTGAITSVTIADGGEYAIVGVIQSVTVTDGGFFYKDSGVIESVIVFYGGYYYHDDGIITAVSLTDGGQFYREDPSESPYVSGVTVQLFQTEPSDGVGATFTATVDDDTASETFGQIVGIEIDNAGDDYLAWEWENTKCCQEFYGGKSFVLQRGTGSDYSPCIYRHDFCGVGNLTGAPGRLTIEYLGPGSPPTVTLLSELSGSGDASGTPDSEICNTTFNAPSAITNCSEFSFVATSSAGSTATVEAGGEYDATDGYEFGAGSCFICCKGTGQLPEEVEVSFVGQDTNAFDGNYVLARDEGYDDGSQRVWLASFDDPNNVWFNLLIRLRLCATQTKFAFGPRTLPSEDECDECHESCSTDAVILYQGVLPGLGGFIIPVSSLESDPQPSCDDVCEPTPLCGPTPGAYVIDDWGTATLS